MTDVRDFVCESAGAATMSFPSSFVAAKNETNPIGSFELTKLEIIRSGTADLIDQHPIVGRLLLLASVSAFENYCRGVLSGCLAICPISQGFAAEKNVSLGGAIWHGVTGNFNRSAFEHKSLADIKELKSVFREYIKYELVNQIYDDLLKSLETIMQLRHAVVHSDGLLPGRNAVKLEISRGQPALVVTLSQNKVQECLLVISALVATINREIFDLMCRRWAIDWRNRADWDASREVKSLGEIYDLFVDKVYNSGLPRSRSWTKSALKRQLYVKYDL